MSTSERVSWLRKTIVERSSALNDQAEANRQRAFQMRMLVTGLSALTTVLIGIKGLTSAWSIGVQNIALATSALVSMFSAWDAFFNYRTNWLTQQKVVGLLKELEKDLNYLTVAGEDTVEGEKLDELYERYRQIMSDYNSAWADLKRASGSQAHPG
ncbi:MAG: DUF4231 domain-containing protein [Longimicrobiaceae bacterium]